MTRTVRPSAAKPDKSIRPRAPTVNLVDNLAGTQTVARAAPISRPMAWESVPK